jgi:hypothetical protein
MDSLPACCANLCNKAKQIEVLEQTNYVGLVNNRLIKLTETTCYVILGALIFGV